jgi:hypothetical protein
MAATIEAIDLFNEIAADMVLSFHIGLPEAVARINSHWRGQEFLDEESMLFHEDAHYWAMLIYYKQVSDWRPEADRSNWRIRGKPATDSDCWTIGSG